MLSTLQLIYQDRLQRARERRNPAVRSRNRARTIEAFQRALTATGQTTYQSADTLTLQQLPQTVVPQAGD
jgi:hypothetical protein